MKGYLMKYELRQQYLYITDSFNWKTYLNCFLFVFAGIAIDEHFLGQLILY